MDICSTDSSTATVSNEKRTAENTCQPVPAPSNSLPAPDHFPTTLPAQILRTPYLAPRNSSPEQNNPQASQNGQTGELPMSTSMDM